MDKIENYIMSNPEWSLKEMITEIGLSDKGAKNLYGIMNFTKGGRIDPRAIENVRNFLIKVRYTLQEKDSSSRGPLYHRDHWLRGG
jgi:hypothetical protein